MNEFSTPVSQYMVSPVRTIRETDSVLDAERELATLGISALPVVDRAGAMVGVLSRTDLLRAGRTRSTGNQPRALVLPRANVRDLMRATVEIVAPSAPLDEAARRMVRGHMHRLFVSEDRRPAGVVSTTEMMRAVIFARLGVPIAEIMHGSLIVVEASAPLSLAIERLALAHRSGLVVVEEGWPVGMFTQVEALAARDASPDERTDGWMDPHFICLPLAMPAFRAAEQAVATRSHRVLAVDAEGARGILTGMDFAELVKGWRA